MKNILLIFLFIVGCSKPAMWINTTEVNLNMPKDDYECQRDAKLTHPPADFGGGLGGAAALFAYKRQREQFYEQCMEVRGWRKAK